MARLKVEVDGDGHSVDSEDVLAWRGLHPSPGTATETAAEHAAAYVRANPRPDPDAQGAVNMPARQRRALLRRLAAGPATRAELTAAMRAAAGYVGGDDWRNRMDELRGRGKRGGGHAPLPLVEEDGLWRLTEPFPSLSAADVAAAAELLAVLETAGPPAAAHRHLLRRLLPGLTPAEDAARGPLATALRSQEPPDDPPSDTADSSRR